MNYIKIDLLKQLKSYIQIESRQQKNKQNELKIEDKFSVQAKLFFKRPIYIENYFLVWLTFSIYATFKFIFMIPISLLFSVLRILVSLFLYFINKHLKKKNQTIFIFITLASFLLFCCDFQIFDTSYLYHSFRGQSTLKFYGLLFAFEVSEKILTQVGKPIIEALRDKIFKFSFWYCWKEIISFFIYLSIHTYSIYLQFIVFIVVINSDTSNFIIYCFVMNLTKMKSTAFKKFDDLSYKNQINYDMKDRMQKIVYILLFTISQSHRNVNNFTYKLCFVFFIGMFIEWIKHTTVISLSQKKISLQNLKPNLINVLTNENETTICKCLKMDYNLFPLATFILKMINTIFITQNQNLQFTKIAQTILILLVYLLALPTLTGVIKMLKLFFQQYQQKLL